MLRPFVSAMLLCMPVLAASAGEQAESHVQGFAKDLENLNGSWLSPTMTFAPGVTGRLELKLVFKKDSTIGQATVLNFVSKNGVFVPRGPTWIAELKAKDKQHYLVLAEKRKDQRVEVNAIQYEVHGDKLKLTSPKGLQVEKGGYPLELNGEWERTKPHQE